MEINIGSQPRTQHQNNKKKKFYTIVIISLVIIAIILTAVFVKASKTKTTTTPQDKTTLDDSVKTSPTPTELPKPKDVESPINGKMLSPQLFNDIKTRPPLAVIIQNQVDSRPQGGIQEADVVYETLAEGGITRLLGIFWSNDANRIISIRSARRYFVELTGDFKNSVFMHIGYAEGAKNVSAISALNEFKVRNLGFSDASFLRDKQCEAIKATEHCAYSSTKMLWDLVLKNNWQSDISQQESLMFKDTNAQSTNTVGKPLSEVKIKFSDPAFNGLDDPNYRVIWRYDPASNTYKRFNNNGTAFVDSNSQQVTTNVLIYQQINSVYSGDAKSHQIQDVIGNGKGFVFQDGASYPITWKKASYNARTRFYDATTGSEFVFTRGKLWVSLVSKTIPVAF